MLLGIFRVEIVAGLRQIELNLWEMLGQSLTIPFRDFEADLYWSFLHSNEALELFSAWLHGRSKLAANPYGIILSMLQLERVWKSKSLLSHRWIEGIKINFSTRFLLQSSTENHIIDLNSKSHVMRKQDVVDLSSACHLANSIEAYTSSQHELLVAKTSSILKHYRFWINIKQSSSALTSNRIIMISCHRFTVCEIVHVPLDNESVTNQF